MQRDNVRRLGIAVFNLAMGIANICRHIIISKNKTLRLVVTFKYVLLPEEMYESSEFI
jgi:hypothetical protein